MNDSNQIRDAFAHYRYRRASQLLEGDSDAHWVIAYQHADELIDFDSFEAAWVLQESAITSQRDALARVEAELRIERMALAEAIDLIGQVLSSGDLEGRSPTLLTKLESCAAYNAQAEQQEARGALAGDFWTWLDFAYRDGSKGEGRNFTKYNMEVAYHAGILHARAALATQPASHAGEFQREDRYIVIKRKDLEAIEKSGEASDLETHEAVRFLAEALDTLRPHLPAREYLVIESDWPEYEPTWAAIQARVIFAERRQVRDISEEEKQAIADRLKSLPTALRGNDYDQ